MYTYEITSQTNGVAIVSFSNGDTETYTEQVTVSDAIFATEDTPFIPPVFEIIEHTRPKVIVVTFPDDAELTNQISARLDTLNGIVAPIPDPTPEEVARLEAQAARVEWNQKKSALAQMIDDMEKGRLLNMEPTVEQMAIMTGLAQWVNANLKQEYYF